ncbi:Sortase (surface protein transpeptidase) [Blautia hydrogenotrophica]|uniref:class C sortase n=1 Tax=Blautia hydrogenotrophica TaxID=53443 RepID=UPI0006C5CDF5|nr:class C sortase [Blautia hydrogenotrophica]CUN11434.1 Sortase (surface protein transpeptidase) [Blautia hydrogenotrophica]SCH69511.1 Sortase (surface protein transpeptidase) [uncultured Blautia sp.]
MGRKTEKDRRRNPWIFLAPLLVFAAGAGIFLYPAVSNFLAERAQTNVIRSYQAAVDESNRQKLEEEWQKAEEYNENLAGDPVHDPFVMGSGYVLPDNYEEVLNLNGDGVMGYLEIPRIDVELPIYHGTSEEVLEKGAGHLEATALPIGGKNRHPVISAHRGLPSAELFTRLDEMEIGDWFYLSVLDETLAYEVDKITVIEPEELEFLTPEENRDLLTLLTCTPYGVNTHRLLVRGTRVPYEETEFTKTGKEPEKSDSWRAQYLRAVLTGAALLAVLGLIIIGRRRRRGRHRDSN